MFKHILTDMYLTVYVQPVDSKIVEWVSSGWKVWPVVLQPAILKALTSR